MRILLLALMLLALPAHGDQLLRQFDAENGTVGQNPPPPLKNVTYNWPTITNEVVQAGTKSYRIWLTNDGSLFGGNPNALYRTEMEGFVENNPPRQVQFDHVYYMRIDFFQSSTLWAPDASGESWPVQMHEVPVNLAQPGTNDWANWGVGTCQQSANSTAPFFVNWNNGIMSFRRWGGVPLWTATPAKGVWHKLVIRIKVSRTSSGFVQSWFDGVQQPSYSGQTHRADSALNVYCGTNTTAVGDVGFQNPKWAVGLYKYTWRNGVKTDADRRLGYIDNIYWAEDTTLNGSAAALVGGTGALGGDTTPPVISAISETLLTPTDATINWTTNEAANERVEYGTTTAYGSNVTTAAYTASHAKPLTGLLPNTLYNYRIIACDSSGNCTTGSNRQFTTLPTTSTYSNITVSNLTATGYTVTWTTAVPRTSIVNHGATTAYGLTPVVDNTLVTNHSLSVSGLTPSTGYNFKLGGLDGGGVNAESANQTIRTLHSITSLSAINITTTGFTVSATTSELTTSTVNYGTTTAYGSTRTRAGTRTDQLVDIAPNAGITLAPNTLYHFQFCGINSVGVNACSADQTVTTAADPTIITGVTITKTSTTITLQWDTPVSSNSIAKYGKRYGNWTTVTDTNLLTTGHSITLTGLSPNTSYAIVLRSEVVSGTPLESAVMFIKTKTVSGMEGFPFSWLDDYLEAA